jgi:hypothetical protein
MVEHKNFEIKSNQKNMHAAPNFILHSDCEFEYKWLFELEISTKEHQKGNLWDASQ